jgi:hypothetical protein
MSLENMYKIKIGVFPPLNIFELSTHDEINAVFKVGLP